MAGPPSLHPAVPFGRRLTTVLRKAMNVIRRESERRRELLLSPSLVHCLAYDHGSRALPSLFPSIIPLLLPTDSVYCRISALNHRNATLLIPRQLPLEGIPCSTMLLVHEFVADQLRFRCLIVRPPCRGAPVSSLPDGLFKSNVLFCYFWRHSDLRCRL